MPTRIINPAAVTLPQNLMLSSEDIAPWSTIRASESVNQIANPMDGAVTADLITENTETNSHYTQRAGISVIAGNNYTFSVFAKTNGRNIRLTLGTVGFLNNTTAYYDLTAGTVGTVGSDVVATTIADAGGGWYRCSITGTCDVTTSSQDVIIWLVDGETTNYAGDGTSGVYLSGWQLNVGSSALAYTQTLGVAIPGGETVGRLPQNLLLQSEDFNTTWVDTKMALEVDSIANPIDSTVNADKFVDDSSTGTGQVFVTQNVTVPSASTYTFSVYAKADGVDWIQLLPLSFTGITVSAYYDLTNGVVGATTGANNISQTIEDVGGGWYRCSITFAPLASDLVGSVRIYLAEGNADNIVDLDGTSSAYVWGAQIENYSTVGTYQKTTSAAANGGDRALIRLPQNLFKESQDLTKGATWLNTNTAETGDDATAPDGTLTADKMEASTTGSQRGMYQGIGAIYGPHVFSAYVSADTTDWLAIRPEAAGNRSYFDLTNGVVGTKHADHDLIGIEPASNTISGAGASWYRVWVVQTFNGETANCSFDLASADNDTSVVAGDSLHFWGFQAEAYADGPGTYTATTTAAVPGVTITRASTATYHDSQGILRTAAVGQERTNYAFNGTNWDYAGVLIEESRTNICTYSEDFSTGWTIGADLLAVVGNEEVAPDGTLTADKLVDDNAGGTGYSVYAHSQAITWATSTVYTVSAYLKKDGESWSRMRVLSLGALNLTAYFDLENGAVGTTGADVSSAAIKDVGNGWYRCSMTFTSDASDTSASVRIYVASADGNDIVPLDSTSSIFAWGVQVEVGGHASSYIPNLSTGSSTRESDDISTTDVSWYTAGAQTWHVIASIEGVMTDHHRYFNGFTDANNRVVLTNNATPNIQAVSRTTSGQDIVLTDGNATNQGQFYNVAVRIAADDSAMSVDGAAVTVDTSGSTIPSITTFRIGKDNTEFFWLDGCVKSLTHYNKGIKDDDLVTLSSGGTLDRPSNMMTLNFGIGL